MKAKFIAVKGQFEIRLEDGTIFTSNKSETSKAFTKRIKETAALDQGDLDISEVTKETFSKFTVEQLTAAKAKESGLLADLLQEVIDSKSNNVKGMSDEAKNNITAMEAAKTKKADAEKAKAEAAAKKLADKEAAAKVKAEAAAKKAEEKAAAKAAKVSAPKQTLEEVLTAAAEAKANVGKAVKFCPHRTAMKIDGVVNGVWVDKRVPMALYRIFDEDGVMYNKIINAPDLEFGELVPNKKAEERAAAKAEKEIAAKAKKEEAEKAKTEKAEAKIKATAEKAEAAKVKAEEKVAAAKAKAEKIAADAQAKVEAAEAKKAEIAAQVKASK